VAESDIEQSRPRATSKRASIRWWRPTPPSGRCCYRCFLMYPWQTLRTRT